MIPLQRRRTWRGTLIEVTTLRVEGRCCGEIRDSLLPWHIVLQSFLLLPWLGDNSYLAILNKIIIMHFIYKTLILHWHARCLPLSTAVKQLNFIELSNVIPMWMLAYCKTSLRVLCVFTITTLILCLSLISFHNNNKREYWREKGLF